MEKINILLIEDEEFDVQRVVRTLDIQKERLNLREIVSDGNTALSLIGENPDNFDVVIMDFQIAGGLMGEKLIREIKAKSPWIQIIVITKLTVNDTRFEFAAKLLEAGAFWYCTKYPTHITDYIYQPTDFLISLHNAHQKKILEMEKYRVGSRLDKNINLLLSSKKIIGDAPKTKKLIESISRYAAHDVNVLIYGESGTGKELVAHNLHYNSSRRFEEFVRINCGSIPGDLVESELFGFEKYAFTGAGHYKKGLFEVADKGTVFLDEIGDLPLNAQAKLLRVLQDGEIEKIGRSSSVKVDVRVIAASNKDLSQEVKEKRFREDLYFRLNIIPLEIPPLRERKEDIPVLLDFYLDKYSGMLKITRPEFSPEANKAIMNYRWPGNVRELKNFAQRILFNESSIISAENVNSALGGHIGQSDNTILDRYFDRENILPLKKFEGIARREYVQFVRELSENDSSAANRLGVAQPNFSRMIKDLDLR